MAHETVGGALGELRAATASGGASLTTTLQRVLLPSGSRHVFVTPFNPSGATVVASAALLPYLTVFKTADDLATVTDYSLEAQDESTSTDVTLSSLGTAAQGDYLYVGSWMPFGGATIDVDAANGTASVLTVKYWNGSAWADISATDGTASGGASLAVDGSVTWTAPAAWTPATLRTIASPAPAATVTHIDTRLYWTRWEFSGGLDSSTTLNSLIARMRGTAPELVSGQTLEFRIEKAGRRWDAWYALQAGTNTGTASMVVNVAAGQGAVFPS